MSELFSDAGTDPIRQELNDLRREVNQLKSALSMEHSSIGAAGLRILEGGTLTISGGALRMNDATGLVGLLFFGQAHADGQRIWQFSFDDGEPAFGLAGSPGATFWAGRDYQSNVLVSNDSESGVGLGKPYFNIPMYPSAGTSIGTGGPFWPEFVNSSFQEVMHCITTLWHPRIAVGVNPNADSGDVEWELRVDGVTAGSGTGTSGGEFDVPGWGDTTNPGDQRSVQLWARNTLGTATRLIVDRCYGTRS